MAPDPHNPNRPRTIPGTAPAMNDPRYASYMKQVRSDERAKADRHLENSRANFVGTVELAAAKNPSIPLPVFAAIADEHNRLHTQLVKEFHQAWDKSPTPGILDANLNSMRTKYAVALREKIHAEHGEDGIKALQAVTKGMQSPSIFSGPLKTFYNSENGGMQWAGIIGGLTAAFAGFKLTASAGTLVQVLATVALGAAGAFMAHKYVDPKPEPLNIPHFPNKYRQPQQAKGKEKGDELVAVSPEQNFDRILKEADAKPQTPAETPDARQLGIRDANLAERTGGLGQGA